jgi:hypothetical protein
MCQGAKNNMPLEMVGDLEPQLLEVNDQMIFIRFFVYN